MLAVWLSRTVQSIAVRVNRATDINPFICPPVCLPRLNSPVIYKLIHQRQGRRSYRIIGGDIKEDWDLGDASPPAGSRGRASVGGLGRSPQGDPGAEPWWGIWADEGPQFCETTHNICITIQQTTVAVTRVEILNDITSKILGTLPWMSLFHKYWGTCPPLSHRDRRPWP